MDEHSSNLDSQAPGLVTSDPAHRRLARLAARLTSAGVAWFARFEGKACVALHLHGSPSNPDETAWRAFVEAVREHASRCPDLLPMRFDDCHQIEDSRLREAALGAGVGALVAASLSRNEGGVVEHLGVSSLEPRGWSDEEVEALVDLAETAASAPGGSAPSGIGRRGGEATLRAIFDTTFQFIGALTPEGDVIEANRRALEFAGVDLDEIAGLPFAETPWWSGSEEQQARLRAAVAEAARGRFVRFEAEHPGADGSVITVDFSLTPVRDESGRVVMLVSEGRDISERKRAEQVLAARERLLQLATRAAGLGVWDWDLSMGQIRFAGELNLLVGRGPDEFVGSFEAFLQMVHEDDRSTVLEDVATAREHHREYRGEYRLAQADGTSRWVAARGGFLYDEVSGQATRMVGVCLDVNDRRRLEEQARDRAAELMQADKRKDEFLAMLAHELRNPLASISHAVRVLELRDSEATLRIQMRDLIGRQARSLTQLVDDLLDVTRVSRGKIRLRRIETDLAGLIRRAVTTARPLVQVREHTLSVDLPSAPLRLFADPLRMEQVLVNLLSNAAKYTDPGGDVCIGARVEGETVAITVRDSGIGIAPEFLPRVFEPFAQADGALARSGGGLGIGLTLVRSLVRMHGGTVAAESEGPGRGSTFVLRLPLAQASTPSPPPGTPSERPAREGASPSASRRVLVVDDNVNGAETLAMILEVWGHVVSVCHDGLAALDRAGEFRPEVVLLDIGLPGLDGYAVAERLRERPEHADTLIAAVTGYGGEEHRDHARSSGFDHHFVKPLDLEELERFLARPESSALLRAEAALARS